MIYSLGDKTPSIDSQSWIAPNAIVIGDVEIRRDASIWFNAIVRGDCDKIVIGRECIIGANALIPAGRVIPDRSLVVGSPGKVVRQLSDEEAAGLSESAHHYVDNARDFAAGLKPVA